MSKTLEQTQKRFEELLGRVDETTLVVLKGHLLIEEMLESIITKFVFHPEFVEEASLRFAQKVAIARSMSLDEHENEMWQLAIKLNSLRNELAHSLSSPKRTAKTKAVIDLYFELTAEMPYSESQRSQPEPTVLAYAIALFLGFLSTFEDEVARFRAFVDSLDQAVNPHRHKREPGQK